MVISYYAIFIVILISNNLANVKSVSIINYEYSEAYHDIDPNRIAREFEEYMKNEQNNESIKEKFAHLKKPRHLTCLDIHLDFIDASAKIQILNRFLVTKIIQFNEHLNSINIHEFKITAEKLFTIVKYENKPKIELETFGSTVCSLEKNAKLKQSLSVCPSHFVIVKRLNRFPYERPQVVCNCKDCQAKTIYDSDKRRLSGCIEHLTLVPFLYNEDSFKSTDKKERWCFGLEEIPTECICSLKLNPL